MKPQSGFTLIELSIVLVIIALIIGGVLTGKDLIRASEVRSTIAQIQATQTAINTFENKYNCLPGDCANASKFFPNAVNGDGDGEILYNAAIDNGDGAYLEEYDFWSHLSAAGLISGDFPPFTGDSFDTNPDIQDGEMIPPVGPQALAPSVAVDASFLTAIYCDATFIADFPALTPGNYLALSQIPYPDELGCDPYVISDLVDYRDFGSGSFGLYPQDAFIIDTKMDDGLPLSGSVSVFNIPNGGLGCVTANVNTYNLTPAGNAEECVMYFKFGIQ